MSERQGIEIDYCSKCRGVWLDRGELDKIIERSSASPDDDRRGQGYGREGYGGTPVEKRKKSFFDDLLDFG
jgi:Zn-finger nucleic acid-binding protein